MSQSEDGLRTPLYDAHVSGGGKMVPFAGYMLPVQYGGVIAEHNAVRNAAGIFDVSHMGEILYEGPDALLNLQRALSNDFSKMNAGRVKYSLICNDDGGIKDDVLVYKYGAEKFLVVVNAANRKKDFEWLASRASGDVSVKDVSDGFAQIALQGPLSRDILSRVSNPSGIPEKYYTFTDGASVAGAVCMVSRTGYTGELGYEIYAKPEDAAALWKSLLDAGRDFGLVPAGLGARDTLRLEAGMPLYGHEMDESVTPFEAGLGFGVNMSKEDFTGKAALICRGDPKHIRAGLRVTGRGIVRERENVLIGGEVIGRTTSGTFCPYLQYPVAMASVDAQRSAVGTKVGCDVRGRSVEAEIVPLPFFSRKQ
ncbi:MAG: glycine cleavage system aminomethyltransferase GcvT [Synergistaceae bacterium]|nr:glycine cleavage system aminomethyltransferase GcvT [Synergistaceae bacterium]